MKLIDALLTHWFGPREIIPQRKPIQAHITLVILIT